MADLSTRTIRDTIPQLYRVMGVICTSGMKSEMERPSDSAANTPRVIIPESSQGFKRSRGKSALSARRRTVID
jgi:hypothetical protein